MAVGQQPTKQDIDFQCGQLVRELDNLFYRIGKFKAWLDTKTEQDLTAMGYTAGDVATLKSAYAQITQGWAVMNGQATQAEANDFLYFAHQLVGFGF